jgi:hypothetical protein
VTSATFAPSRRARASVETRRVDPHDRHRDAGLQIRAVGAASDHDIRPARARSIDLAHRVFEAM